MSLRYSLTSDIITEKVVKILDPKIITSIVLKMKQFGFTMEYCIQKRQVEWQTVSTLSRSELHAQPYLS